ncbi:MAG: hypothetical protein IJS71_08355 [Clostridia bacterium]|nr:hypothetical protein [Clostridia bacterium]
MFEWKKNGDVYWPANERQAGYTAYEGSEKVKELVMKYKDKLPKKWIDSEPWLDAAVVSQLVHAGTRESFERQAAKGQLRGMTDIIAFCYDF